MRLPRPLWIGLAAVLLIFVTVGLQIGVPIYRQHVAIHEIGRLGGTVKSVHGGPLWLRRLIGSEPMTPFDLPYSVSLAETAVSDSDLDHLLSAIESRASLQTLWLAKTRVTDAGLVHLKRLTWLQDLRLDETRVTDNGLKEVSAVSSLERLDLCRTQVTDAGLVHLKSMKKLQRLCLTATPVTDSGMAQIESLKHIDALWIEGTLVTDVGLLRLKGLPNLQLLYVRGTRVTDAGIAELRRALPELQVVK
jgi:hypothetical protein